MDHAVESLQMHRIKCRKNYHNHSLSNTYLGYSANWMDLSVRASYDLKPRKGTLIPPEATLIVLKLFLKAQVTAEQEIYLKCWLPGAG